MCNRVPRGADGGYKVSCAEGGATGVFSVCDSTCTNCSVTTRFETDQCLPNPKEFGSASVAIRCPTKALPASLLGRGPARAVGELPLAPAVPAVPSLAPLTTPSPLANATSGAESLRAASAAAAACVASLLAAAVVAAL